ncbi:MAG: cardiolipin synthase [Lachnospiraceae bacterium]|nr:cardiolipin synthase [Lachnospiraceae bacterium]
MKKTLEKIFSRIFLVSIAILLQILWICGAMFILSWYYKAISIVFLVLSVIMVFRNLIKWDYNPSYVLAWSVPMLVFPVFGLTIYFLFGRASLTRNKRRKYAEIQKKYSKYLSEGINNRQAYEEVLAEDVSVARQTDYITKWAGYPLWKDTYNKYYESGEAMFPDMLKELRKAKHFIFMEFFIINTGVMWDSVLEILEQKVKEGVDVRLTYDDVGSISYLPAHYYKVLQAKGIKCAAFNPYRPVMSVIMNNRNHRKILVVDGHTAFTGGINLADEYINAIVRFGYWKDTGIMLKGPAVWSFTCMFLSMWEYITGVETPEEELLKMRPQEDYKEEIPESPGEDTKLDRSTGADGYVQPYCDSPLTKEYIGENVYRNIISRAKHYCYIITPYLIIGNEMMTTICIAAKSGVDIRVITPEIPDKPTIYMLTQSYYERLIKAGVKVYQFTPGFIHAKSFVCDDEIATVGSINLDFRSLYMHFECGCWMYKTDSVMDVKRDFLATQDQSREITLEFCKDKPLLKRAAAAFLRLFAPVL